MTEPLLCYEHPLNERMRACLRMEFLLKEFQRYSETAGCQRALVLVICDILSLLSRPEAWSDLGKDLQHEMDTLNTLRNMAGVDQGRLDAALEDLRSAQQQLSQVSPGSVRLPKLLLSVIQRSSVPGGLAPADIPAFTWWLNQAPQQQQQDIGRWTESLPVYRQALGVYLDLIRSHGEWQVLDLEQGSATLQARSRHALLRLGLEAGSTHFPEFSGGRQRLILRLRTWEVQEESEAPAQVQIALC